MITVESDQSGYNGYSEETPDVAPYIEAVGEDDDDVYEYEITNTHENDKVNIPVKKLWDDENDRDGIRPLEIKVYLLSDDNESGELQRVVDEEGNEVYIVLSETVEDDSDNQNTDDQNVDDPQPTEDDVDGVVSGENDPAAEGDDATVEDPDAEGDDSGSGDAIETDSYDAWTGVFRNLNKYMNKDGEAVEITYSIEEEEITEATSQSGYAVDMQDEKTQLVIVGSTLVGMLDEDGNLLDDSALYPELTLTNRHTPDRTKVAVEKVWDDQDDRDGIRPDAVVIHLFADGVDTGETVTLDESNEWKATFPSHEKYRDHGVEIEYTITEDAVTGYEVAIMKAETAPAADTAEAANQEVTPNTELTNTTTATSDPADNTEIEGQDGQQNDNDDSAVEEEETVVDNSDTINYTVTNTHECELTSIKVSKVWDDNNNKSGKRPDEIIVYLTKDGKATTDFVKLSAKNNWTATFNSDVTVDPMYKYQNGGKLVQYGVKEVAVSGYKTTITGDMTKGYTITNKLTSTGGSGKSASSPKTGDSNMPFMWAMLAVAGCGTLAVAGRRRRKEEN